jgi:hypothetical protein
MDFHLKRVRGACVSLTAMNGGGIVVSYKPCSRKCHEKHANIEHDVNGTVDVLTRLPLLMNTKSSCNHLIQ